MHRGPFPALPYVEPRTLVWRRRFEALRLPSQVPLPSPWLSPEWWPRLALPTSEEARATLEGRPARMVAALLVAWVAVTTTLLATLPTEESARRTTTTQSVATDTQRARTASGGPLSANVPSDVVPSVASVRSSAPSEPAPSDAPLEAGQPLAGPPVVQVLAPDGTPIVGPGGGPLGTLGLDLYDCEQFEDWEQALAVYLASGPGDPNHLDAQGTGLPCPELALPR